MAVRELVRMALLALVALGALTVAFAVWRLLAWAVLLVEAARRIAVSLERIQVRVTRDTDIWETILAQRDRPYVWSESEPARPSQGYQGTSDG